MLAKLKSTAAGLMFYMKYIDAVTHAVQVVFLVAVPISFVAFLLSFLLPEVELRKTVQTVDLGEVHGMPDHRSSLQEIELALTRMSSRENRGELYHTLAQRAGIELPPVQSGSCTGWPTGLPARRRAGRAPEGRPRADPARHGWPVGRRHDRGAPSRVRVTST